MAISAAKMKTNRLATSTVFCATRQQILASFPRRPVEWSAVQSPPLCRFQLRVECRGWLSFSHAEGIKSAVETIPRRRITVQRLVAYGFYTSRVPTVIFFHAQGKMIFVQPVFRPDECFFSCWGIWPWPYSLSRIYSFATPRIQISVAACQRYGILG